MRARGAVLLTLALLAARPAAAEVVFDSTLGPAGPAPAGVIGSTAVDYLIEPDRGALRGSNLFFSFERFSIESGRIGAFNGPAEVQNVLARVTGGDLSRIDGTLGSAIPGADLWLVNPAGVAFGAGSRLALGGALHLSTADYVRHADGSEFSARAPAGATLTAASPEAFGFLGSAAPIEFDVAGRTVQGRQFERMALVAGDVWVHGGEAGEVGFLWSPDGRIDLVAVESDGSAPVEVSLLRDGAVRLDVTGPWRGGEIRIDRDAGVSSSGLSPAGGAAALRPGGGDIGVFADSLVIDDGELRSPTAGNERGGDIDIRLSGDLVLRSRDERAAQIVAGTGVRQGNAVIAGGGAGGNIAIRARSVSLEHGARMSTTSLFFGDAGEISIDALEGVRMFGRDPAGEPSAIFSRTEFEGAGGRIAISTGRLDMDEGAAIVTEARSGASGGSIEVDVDTLSLRGGARIDSSVRSYTDPLASGGTIEIRARREITISGRESDEVFSGITAIAQGATDTLPASTARAGDITIQTPRLGIADGGTISTQALGSGDGGTIEIWTGELAMNGGIISASAVEGAGGDVRIHASQRVGLRGGSVITARAEGAGDAGTIALDAGRELRMERSSITTESAESDGGDVSVRARELVALSQSEISTSVSGGTGGSITIDPEHVVLNRSQVVARAGAGTGGSIRIVAGQFIADVDSAVDASSETGIDGTVQIVSPDVDLTGTLDVLPAEFADAAVLMRQACAARQRAGDGSFVVATAARANAAPDAPLGAGEGERAEDEACR